MKIKDFAMYVACSLLTVIFGILLLLDQLNVPFIDDFFTPWYLILILYVAAILLVIAIIKKAPLVYVFSMFFAGLYLMIALPAKIADLSIYRLLFILPLFVGLGTIIGDLTCHWSRKAMRIGLLLTISSAIILVSCILDVWKIVIPVVVILLGLSKLVFLMIDAKSLKNVDEPDDSIYVTPSKKQDINVKKENIADEKTKEEN